jgi:hypothetical protein
MSKAMTKLEVPAADLAACAVSSAEPEDQWVGIVRDGGAAYGLSLDMPSFGDAATDDEIVAIVRYTRSLCEERGWPPGELNFPRAFLVEKAFPENEIVVVAHDREQKFIYERRIGRRLQFEGVVRTVLDGGSVFGGVGGALKYNIFHDRERGAIASLGLEVVPPVGRQDELEIEPFLTAGVARSAFILQGSALAKVEDGFRGGALAAGVGRDMGRFVPMLEAGWTVVRGGPNAVSLYPQVWIQLSRLGHVAGSIGMEIPVAGPGSRTPLLAAFLLWDFGDGPINRGW